MYVPIPGGRCRKGGKKSRSAVMAASIVAAISALVTAFVQKQVQDGGPPKEFPWIPVGIATAALIVVAVAALIQWRRRQEKDGEDKDGGGPCSR